LGNNENGESTGAVDDNELGDGGADYEVGDHFVIATGSQATGVVDQVSAGAVTAYHLTANGEGYLVADGVATLSDDGGTGLTIDIGSVTPPNGTARIYLDFDVLPLP
jgi:hypothetical protein